MEHIGKTPDKYNDAGNLVMSSGSGQSREVMGTMIQMDIQKQRGEALANSAFWNRPLWDSDKDNDGESDGFFSAPTIMSVAKIALTVAGGGPWLSFALDAFDTVANVAAGRTSFDEGLGNLAKGAATTAIGSFASGLGDSVGTAMKGAGASSFISSVSSSIISSSVNAYSGAVLGAVSFSNGLSFDKDVYKEGLKSGLRSVAISTTAAIVSGAVNSSKGAEYGEYTNPATGKTQTGFNFQTEGVLNKMSSSMLSVGNMAGSLASQAVSYAVGNGVSLNLLNSSDLGLGGNSTGLLNLTMGARNKGIQNGFSVSSAGADISYNAMQTVAAGNREFSFMDRINNNGQSSLSQRATLASVNMMRWSGNKSAGKIAEGIVDGEFNMKFDAENSNLVDGKNLVLDDSEIELDKDGNISKAAQARMASIGTYLGLDSSTSLQGTDLARQEVGVWSGLKKVFGSEVNNWEMDKNLHALKMGDDAFETHIGHTMKGMKDGQRGVSEERKRDELREDFAYDARKAIKGQFSGMLSVFKDKKRQEMEKKLDNFLNMSQGLNGKELYQALNGFISDFRGNLEKGENRKFQINQLVKAARGSMKAASKFAYFDTVEAGYFDSLKNNSMTANERAALGKIIAQTARNFVQTGMQYGGKNNTDPGSQPNYADGGLLGGDDSITRDTWNEKRKKNDKMPSLDCSSFVSLTLETIGFPSMLLWTPDNHVKKPSTVQVKAHIRVFYSDEFSDNKTGSPQEGGMAIMNGHIVFVGKVENGKVMEYIHSTSAYGGPVIHHRDGRFDNSGNDMKSRYKGKSTDLVERQKQTKKLAKNYFKNVLERGINRGMPSGNGGYKFYKYNPFTAISQRRTSRTYYN